MHCCVLLRDTIVFSFQTFPITSYEDMTTLLTQHHPECTPEEEAKLLREVYDAGVSHGGIVVQALRQLQSTTETHELYGDMRSAWNKASRCKLRPVRDMLYYEVDGQIRGVSQKARRFCKVTITFRKLDENQGYLRYHVSVPVGKEIDGYHIPKGEQTHIFMLYREGSARFEEGIKVTII